MVTGGRCLGSVTRRYAAPRRRDYEFKDRLLLINTVPVRSNGVIIGAISTFRDKTEVRKLMQRLDGLVNYADALRERSHEFMNKLPDSRIIASEEL